MSNFDEFVIKLRENKPFICAVLFISFSLGLFSFYHPVGLKFAYIFTFVLLLISFILMVKFKKVSGLISYFLLFVYLIFMFGFLDAKIRYVDLDDFSNFSYLKNVELSGRVVSIPKHNSTSGGYKFKFLPDKLISSDINKEIKNSVVLVSVPEIKGAASIKYADKLKLNGVLSTPSASYNPSQFNYRKFLNNKGILKVFYSKDSEITSIVPPKFSDIKEFNAPFDKIRFLQIYFTKKMNDLRDRVIFEHSKYIKSPRLEVLGGVVFGDDAVNPPDIVKGSFINSGLLHLLAASGLNVALILSMWLCVLYFINIPYRLKIFSGIFMVFLYAVMTGFPPSIIRASVMFVLILIGKLLYREANGLSLIFMAGFLILVCKPEFILDVGFQLSFLVTFGLIACVPCVNHLLKEKDKNFIKNIERFPKLIKSFFLIFSPTSLVCCFLIPFVAQLWAGPLQAYYFNTFSIYSVFANIAVVPFIGVVSFLGFISTAFCLIPFVSKFLLPVTDFILNFIIQIILNISNFFSGLQNSIITVPSPSPLMIFSFYLFVCAFFVSLKYLFKRKILNKFLLVSLLLFAVQFIKIKDNALEIIFFSVGNADNCLIKTPDNKYIMIDTGRYIYNGLSSAKTVTLEYLYDKNIKEIDVLIVTHYDSDHSGGLIDILDKIKVKNLVIPKPVCTSKNSCQILNYIKENNVKYTEPYTGQEFKFANNLKLTNFVPISNSKDSKNDSSTVSLLDYNGYKILFMADVGVNSFDSISEMLPDDVLILKVAHHGAKQTVNSSILDKLHPKYSILSTGKNPYGHPDKNTVIELMKHSKVLSTKDLGAIKFNIKDDFKGYYFDYQTGRFKPVDNLRYKT